MSNNAAACATRSVSTLVVLVAALRAVSREDLALMPKGDKIAKLLRI